MINTDKIKSYLILKNQRHQRSICRKIGISLMLLLTVAWVNAGIDSLKQVIATAKEDTTKINALNALGWELMYTNPDTAIILSTKALEIAALIASEYSDKSNLLQHTTQKLIANSFQNLGAFNYLKGDYQKALKNYERSLEINKQIGDQSGIAAILGNIGLIYWNQGDYPKTLSCFFSALKIDSMLGNKNGIAIRLGNIGGIYHEYGDYIKALSYYFLALKIDSMLGHKKEIAACLGNIGLAYSEQGDYPDALFYYFRALEIDSVLGNKNGIARRLGNIGIVYFEQGKTITSVSQKKALFNKALSYYFRAIEMDSVLGNKRGISIRLGNIGSLYTKMMESEFAFEKSAYAYKAEIYLLKALAINTAIGRLSGTMHSHQALSELYDTLSQLVPAKPRENRQSAKRSEYIKKAFEHYKKYSAAKDSLFNEDKSKEIGRLEQKHEFEMAEIERKKVESEKLKAESEKIKRRDLLQYSAILIGIFLFFGLILLMGKFNVPVWVVEASVFMLFLLVFEFTLVLLDPTIDAWTGGAPAYKLLLNAALAGLIFPVHGLCERLLKKKIMERR